MSPGDFLSVVGATVEDDNHLDLGIDTTRRFSSCFQTGRQKCGFVVRWDDQ
jgi:hypothetical protein